MKKVDIGSSAILVGDTSKWSCVIKKLSVDLENFCFEIEGYCEILRINPYSLNSETWHVYLSDGSVMSATGFFNNFKPNNVGSDDSVTFLGKISICGAITFKEEGSAHKYTRWQRFKAICASRLSRLMRRVIGEGGQNF